MYKQYNQNITIKIIKYIIIALVLSLSLKYIPSYNIDTNDIIIISCISSITYAVIDMISPSIKIINNWTDKNIINYYYLRIFLKNLKNTRDFGG
jgi:hypothetical protein